MTGCLIHTTQLLCQLLQHLRRHRIPTAPKKTCATSTATSTSTARAGPWKPAPHSDGPRMNKPRHQVSDKHAKPNPRPPLQGEGGWVRRSRYGGPRNKKKSPGYGQRCVGAAVANVACRGVSLPSATAGVQYIGRHDAAVHQASGSAASRPSRNASRLLIWPHS
jgi:hypothetical protein